MKIHFVCVGNAFRSRLAEAYLKSKKIPDLAVSSSGISAQDNESGPVSWDTARILKNNYLIPYMSMNWQQTTKEDLEMSDIVVFMEQEVYDHVMHTLKPILHKYEIWNIADIDEHTNNIEEDIKVIKFTEVIFEEIKKRVNALTGSL